MLVFDYEFESDSESDSSSAFMNLDVCSFLLFICILLNKLADSFFIHFHNRINSYANNANIYYIFSFGISLPKKLIILSSNSLTLAFMYLWS